MFYYLKLIEIFIKCYLVTTFIGVFALDENNKIISFKPFPKDPEKISEKIKSEKIIKEEAELLEELKKKGFDDFVFSVQREGVKFEKENKAENFVRENFSNLALQYKFVESQAELNQLLTKVGIELAKEKIKKAVERDKLVIQAINAVDEINKCLNIFIERLREWYSLHFPEMDRIVKDHEKFAKIVKEFGSRDRIKELKDFAEKSMGAELKEEDIKIIQELSSQIVNLYSLKEKIEKYLEKVLKEIAPNLTELLGATLTAKLIAKAGGLEKLARMTSSTIQLLGAEKALFKYLHGKGKLPKHGLIFMSSYVQKVPEKYRGKVARALASKLSMAAKIDCYSKENRSEKIKKELEERIKEILSKK